MGRLHRSRSVSSTEALDSDNARYITSRIAQHVWCFATDTKSLQTDSPGPYFRPILHEKGKTPGILPGPLDGSQGPTR